MSIEPSGGDGRPLANQHLVVCVAVDPDLRESVRQFCSPLPCRVHTTDRHEEALAMLESTQVSLMLSDHRVNSISGTQFLKDVARRSPLTARVLLGARQEAGDPVQGADDTVHGIIGTWDGPSLQRTIMAILRWQEERARSTTPESPTEKMSRFNSSADRHRRTQPVSERPVAQGDTSGYRQADHGEDGPHQAPRKNTRPT